MVWGETDKTASDIQARSFYGQNSGEGRQRTLRWERSINGQLQNQSSIMQEDYEEFISVTLKTRRSKKPFRMLARNWKHQCLPPCLARLVRKTSMERPVADPMSSNQNLRASWKPVNPQECVWKNLYRIIMRDHTAGKGDNSLQHYNLVHKFIPMPQAMKIPAAKTAVDTEWEKLEKIPAWDLTKVRSKSEVIDEARTKGELRETEGSCSESLRHSLIHMCMVICAFSSP